MSFYKHNSTIRVREGHCNMCPPAAKDQPLIKGLCQNHYQLSLRLKSMGKVAAREFKEDGLSELVEILDNVFSRYVRLLNADAEGMVKCFVTGETFHWKQVDAGHFVPRGCMFLRWDLRNVKPQSVASNRFKDGDSARFAKALEQESPGIVDILMEESHTVYHWTRYEINALIKDYRNKVVGLLAMLNEN